MCDCNRDENLRADFSAMVHALEACTRPWKIATAALAVVSTGLAAVIFAKR